MFKITSTSCRITTFVSNKKLGLTNFCFLSKKKLPAKVMDTQFNKFIYRTTRDFHNDRIADEFETKPIYESSTLEKNFDKLIGASKIKQVIESGYYVDKTKYFQEMIEGYLGYFIIRPKHFGKSLMLDTISEICEGKKNKQLFKNTAIGQSPTYEWKKYAVFKFDFSKLNNESEEQFELALLNQMKENCKKYNIKHRESVGIMSLMHDMREGVANLKNGYESRAVVLIDEYQAPLNNCQNKNKIIRIMRHFFCNLKGKAMVLVTGSSRFGLADIFSPAHNLFDATLYGDVSAICGFTKSELTEVFEDKITEMHR
ncbi:uncharacterized protein in vnfD 5'region-like [Aphidius gifuensis]|uniref:uncharacterized protein in vnfD 5'region-like n=1 Tax=Aphidius gifuensis TaxID=684658 RepID=UPI001CDD0BBF|nr:uncharacterized protein in vnfD 5'region-like [Aphidius gifuensis]